MIKPNFFLVGASKAGTTSLAHALGAHPEVFMSSPKEPNFFNLFDDAETVCPKRLKEYLRIYETASREEIVGEASVSYLASSKAAQHIKSFNPDAKILISLRNPIHRARSLYEMYARHGLKDSFPSTIRDDPWLVNQCFYFEAVGRYLSLFPSDQIMFIDFDDLVQRWDGCLINIFNFLSVSHIQTRNPVLRNKGGVPIHPSLRFLADRRIVEIAKKAIPQKLHGMLDRNIKGLLFRKIEISPYDARYLGLAFSKDIQRLDAVLKTDYFETWIKPAL